MSNKINYTAEQTAGIKALKGNENVFLTGKAGTGKSTVIKAFLSTKPEGVAVVAPTGIAALNVGGSTIHKLFRLGIGALSYQDLLKEDLHYRHAQVLREIKTLIIDEISMVRADLLMAIDARLRKANPKDKHKPFGGIQVVMVGDFGQLPPVVARPEEGRFLEDVYGGPYAFNSHVWSQAGIKAVRLTQPMRQSDPHFIQALNHVREGSHKGLALLNQRAGITPPDDAVVICSRNLRVDEINDRRMAKLKGSETIFEGEVEGEMKEKDFPVPLKLPLKLGAKVMILANDRKNGAFVNGSTGVCTAFGKDYAEVKLDRIGCKVLVQPNRWESLAYEYDPVKQRLTQKVTAAFTQMPLRPFFACTAHKSQGATLDQAYLDLGDASFAGGLLYVALSRVRSFEGLYLAKELTLLDIKTDKRVLPWL